MIPLSMLRVRLIVLATVAISIGLFMWFGVGQGRVDATAATAFDGAVIAEAPTATFPGTGVGPIPDLASGCQPDQGTPLNVSFNVTGISGPPADVNVSVTFGGPNHSWAGDVTTTLIAPNGTSAVLFGRVGATTSTAAGDSSDLGGTYTFADSNLTPPSGGFWQAALAEATGSAPIANGAYRSTNSGGAGATNPMPATNLNAAFAGIPTSNGTWVLRFTDGCAADTGAVSAASLTLTGGAPAVVQHVGDYDGDGKTDFAVARDITTEFASSDNRLFTTDSVREKLRIQSEMAIGGSSEAPGPVGGTIAWFANRSSGGAAIITAFGTAATDFYVPNDYDGDGKTDIAVWRPGTPTNAAFYVLQTTTNTLVTTAFGQNGDDPAITGDYDGDGKADLATYRCPALGAGDGQCFFFFKGTNANPGGNITYVPWGFGETFDFFVNPGDFDGDGKYDFCIQRTNPSVAGAGQFVLLRSSNGGVEYINWGLDSDIIVPGDYDGDGKADFCVNRTNAGAREYWLLTRTGATSFAKWGVSGDVRVPGDYDGDGKTDLAIWRPNANPDQNFFWVRRSSDLTAQVFEWGQQGDAALASWNVH